jgi:CRISPR-associated protein Csb1
VDAAARTALAAIGLAAATLTREEGADLRSRCQLVPTEAFVWELLEKPGQQPKRFELDGDEALELCNQAIDAAKEAGLPWEGEIQLQPSSELLELVRRSQALAVEGGESD